MSESDADEVARRLGREDEAWGAQIRRYMEDGATEIRLEVTSSAGPKMVDCEDCDAYHPVGMCEDFWGDGE